MPHSPSKQRGRTAPGMGAAGGATRTDGVVTGVDAKRSARRDAQHPSSHGSRTRSSRGGSTPHSVPVSVGSAGMPGVESASTRPDGRGLENAAILSARGFSPPPNHPRDAIGRRGPSGVDGCSGRLSCSPTGQSGPRAIARQVEGVELVVSGCRRTSNPSPRKPFLGDRGS
jgi:hypothetical protein